MQHNLDLKLSTGASVWDAWTYGCMKNCPNSTFCPCLPYKCGDVPPRFPVPAIPLEVEYSDVSDYIAIFDARTGQGPIFFDGAS